MLPQEHFMLKYVEIVQSQRYFKFHYLHNVLNTNTQRKPVMEQTDIQFDTCTQTHTQKTARQSL